MSSELRLKKLRGSGGYVMAKVTDQQQSKGNLGGPDLFLAPIGQSTLTILYFENQQVTLELYSVSPYFVPRVR